MLDSSLFALNGWSGGLAGLFLLSLRVAAVFLLTPVLYAMQLPAVVRMLLILSLSVVLALGLQPAAVHVPSEAPGFMVAAATELALGATLGLGILTAFAAFAVAGRLLDVQVGFGIAQVFDPVTQHQVPVLSAAFMQIGVLLFFLLNGHHAILRGVALSLERFPLGQPWSVAAVSEVVMLQMGGLYALGFALVAPVVLCVLLVEIALGVVARNLPQMNLFVIALPIKIAVALVMLALWFSGIGGVMTRVYASIGTNWEKIMQTHEAPPDLQRGR